MEIIRCPRCAKEIHQASLFCRRCGSAIAGPAASVAPPPPPADFPRRAARATTPATRNRPLPKPDPAPSKAGVVALLAIFAGGGIFLTTVRQSVRPHVAPTPPSVRYTYPMAPTTPTPPFPNLPVIPHPPPVTYPQPLRSTMPGTMRRYPTPTPPAPQLGPTIIVEPGQPWDPYYQPRNQSPTNNTK